MTSEYLFESERLRYRPFAERDAAALFELNSNAEVLRYTGDVPFADEADALAFVRAYNHYETAGFGRWIVELKSTGEVIGWAGLKHSPELDEIDVGCRYFQHLWGQGFGTESVLACLKFGFEQLELERIVARAMQNNMGSVRMLEKAGMTFLEPRDFDGFPGVVYELHRQQWRGR